MKQRFNAHYHWVIALVMLIQISVYIGILNNFNGLYVLPVTEDLGISRSTFSTAVSARYLTSFLATMVSGLLFSRYGYRRLVLIGLPLAAGAFFLLSSAKSVLMISFGAAIIGLCDSVCSTPGTARVIGDWFHRWRGTILGVVSCFTGLGGSLFCAALSGIMQDQGWRKSHLFSAAALLLVAVLMFFTACDRPDKRGLRPYGEGELPKKKRHGNVRDELWAGFGLAELKSQPTFYLMIACTFLSCLFVYMAFYTVLPHMQDCGMTAEEAARVQSTMLLLLSAAKLITGFLVDRIGAKWVSVLCITCGIVGLRLMAGVHDMTGGLIAVAIYTFSIPNTSITVPLLTMQLFGYKAHATAEGIFMAMISFAGMVAAPLINAVYDKLGSYSPVYSLSSILQIFLIGLFVVLFRMAEKKKMQQCETEQKAV